MGRGSGASVCGYHITDLLEWRAAIQGGIRAHSRATAKTGSDLVLDGAGVANCPCVSRPGAARPGGPPLHIG